MQNENRGDRTRRHIPGIGARQLTDTRNGLMSLLATADLICLNAVEAQLLAQVPADTRRDDLTPGQARTMASPCEAIQRPGNSASTVLPP